MKPASLFVLLLVALPLSAQTPVPSYLADYVGKDDAAFAWKLVDTTAEGVANLKLTSQKWQGEVWEHDVQVFLPKKAKPNGTMVIYNTGGNPNAVMSTFALAIAEKAQSPVAILYQ